MRYEILDDGIKLSFDSSVADWIDNVSDDLRALAARIAADCESSEIDTTSNEIVLGNEIVSAWPEHVARQAGLPRNAIFPLDLKLSKGLGHPGATLSIRWLQPSSTLPLSAPPTIKGIQIVVAEQPFRLSYPYVETIRLVNDFNAASESNPDEQFRIWSKIRQTLGEDSVESLTETFLRSFRVITADSFTFSFATDNSGEIQLVPVLMTNGDYDQNELKPKKVRALLEVEEERFASRLDDLPDSTAAFPLKDGSYVIVNERLQKALGVIKKIRSSSPAERKRAALHPEAVLSELLGDDLSVSQDSDPLFIETEQYSSRVLDVSEWIAPVVPWIKVDGQAWIPPESYGVMVGESELKLDGPKLQAAIAKVSEAIDDQLPTVEIEGVKLPANQHTLDSLTNLANKVEKRKSPRDEKQAITDNVLVIQTNFDGDEFGCSSSGLRPGKPELPDRLRTQPKQHQIDGVRWLQEHWISGSKGALLADDMGLGKTFQALAFAAWLQELMHAGVYEKKPILIVAPVGLLKNWEVEIEQHLMIPGLGELVHAYGDYIKFLKRGSHFDGSVSLDNIKIGSADLVLTNYEAVSDYQLSFGAINFAAVIFDEAQKIKSPKARMTHAAKALNADFVIAMTGTPIENRLADLWCIADTVQPLALGPLKSFSTIYEGDSTGDALSMLRQRIWQEEDKIAQAPPLLMLRRLKGEKLVGLPEKFEHFPQRDMPTAQAKAYERIISNHYVTGPKGTLGTIQALRSVSLHPKFSDPEADFNPMDSARFTLMFEILDQCHQKGEKALIFLESLELQGSEELPLLLKHRYGLVKLPLVINGTVDTASRQQRVNAFQDGQGFDVMILSPKAGGVGLTLTAANHVIHLSRWWNPAVEDQCSDRVYRIGQTKPVHIYYPMAIYPGDVEHSFDVKLDSLMRRKRDLSRQLLAPPVITHEDYEELLRSVKPT